MNTITKKTIAKEIIYFFTVVALLLLVWAGIEIRNYFFRNKISNISNEISIMKTQIVSIENKFPEFIWKQPSELSDLVVVVKKLDLSGFDQVKVTQPDTIEWGKEILASDFPPIDEFNKVKQLCKAKIVSYNKLTELENKLLYSNETKVIIIWCSIIAFGLLYPIRFIFFLLCWAFKTIKQKDI
jgi:hypothetical protein